MATSAHGARSKAGNHIDGGRLWLGAVVWRHRARRPAKPGTRGALAHDDTGRNGTMMLIAQITIGVFLAHILLNIMDIMMGGHDN